MGKVTYISNAGVLLEIGSSKIMIDGLCNSEIPIYKNTPEEIRKQIINGISPFDNIDVMLYTHHHSDHFDPESTREFLKINTKTSIISTSEVIGRLRDVNYNGDSDRLIEINYMPGEIRTTLVNGIKVQSIAMCHDGKEYDDVQNFAFLIETEGRKILHVGDAKPVKENYMNSNLAEQNINLLIAPFPYIGLSTARSIIESYIKPDKIMAVHMPYRELDSNGWISSTMKSYKNIEKVFFETVFIDTIGQSIDIG